MIPSSTGDKLLAVAVCLFLGVGSCGSGPGIPAEGSGQEEAGQFEAGQDEAAREGSEEKGVGDEEAAPGRGEPRLTPVAAAFDGERALDHVRRLVEIGPRPSGSEGIEATRRYVEEVLGGYGLEVERYPFDADTPEGPVGMVNLVVRVPPGEGGGGLPTVVFAGHYDTKRFEAFRFVGANDAGSSTAILLELGRVLAEHPPSLPVRLVFFDGEEAVVRWSPEDSKFGSRHMVERLSGSGELDEIGALILFDMVGDADLTLDRDLYSTRWLVDLIWSTAEEIGHGEHFGSGVRAVDDDHVPFVEAGVPGVDLIDFSYGPGNRYWHSPFDTVDRLAAHSFQAVGEVALSSLPELARRFASR